jgi:tyrosinase
VAPNAATRAQGETAAPNLRIRKNIATIPANDPIITTYRNAVQKMMALPPLDPRSWYRQAKIHNDSCAHGNWFFLPWHREYLRRFEQIIREVSGDSSFNLPFWDWNNNRQLPASFWGTNNPLNPANLDFQPFAKADPQFAPFLKGLGNARGIPQTELVGNDIDFSLSRLRARVLQASTFVELGSQEATSLPERGTQSFLENALHGNVHGDIGGQMGAFFSPLDPIFWLHHANIDRLWTMWQRRNPKILPPNNWRTFMIPANMFFDGQGKPASQIACGALERAEALGYTYEAVPNQEQQLLLALLSQQLSDFSITTSTSSPDATTRTTFKADAKGENRTNDRIFAAIDVDIKPQELPPAQFLALRQASLLPGPEPVVAHLSLANLPAVPDARYRVFINCDYLTPGVRRADPSYVTTVSLFGLTHGGDHHSGTAVVKVDLSDALAALDGQQRPRRDKLTIQVQPEPLRGAEVKSSISLQRAEVVVTKRAA